MARAGLLVPLIASLVTCHLPFCWKLLSPQNHLAVNCVCFCLFEHDPGKASKDQATDWSLGGKGVMEARLPEQQGPGMYSLVVKHLAWACFTLLFSLRLVGFEHSEPGSILLCTAVSLTSSIILA